jgi:hypothetical protein
LGQFQTIQTFQVVHLHRLFKVSALRCSE